MEIELGERDAVRAREHRAREIEREEREKKIKGEHETEKQRLERERAGRTVKADRAADTENEVADLKKIVDTLFAKNRDLQEE